jgi:hypothetical protein
MRLDCTTTDLTGTVILRMASISDAVINFCGLIQEVCAVKRVALHRLEPGVADDST